MREEGQEQRTRVRGMKKQRRRNEGVERGGGGENGEEWGQEGWEKREH